MGIDLNVEYLMAASGASRENSVRFLPFLRETCERYEITTSRRIAGFLSQIGHESGGMARLEENLNYSIDALLKLFGRHRIGEADARRYGRAPGQTANQEMLANILYGGEFGRKNLGNTKSGDGWRFRGRGLKQLTGRSNYTRCGTVLGLDLCMEPNRLLEPRYAALSAGWFWAENDLNSVADRGDVAEMTRKINGGKIGLAQREALYRVALETPFMPNTLA